MIEERIRAHVDSMASPVLLDDVVDPTYTTVTIGRLPLARPRRIGRPLALAAAVVALVGAVAVVSDDREATLARPGAWSIVAEATPTFAADAAGPKGSISVSEVVPYDGGLVAVGSVSDGSMSKAAVWRSVDGRAWTRVQSGSFTPLLDGGPVELGSLMGQVAVKGRRLVALGSASTGRQTTSVSLPVVWTSDDALGWERHELPALAPDGDAPPPYPVTVVATARGFLVFVTVDPDVQTDARIRTRVLSSADGVTWTLLTGEGMTAEGSYVNGAVVDGDRVIAYGGRGGSLGQPAAWSSNDGGSTWQAIDVPFESTLPHGGIEHAVVTASGVLLTGAARSADVSAQRRAPDGPLVMQGQLDTVAWFSADGRTFEQLDSHGLDTAGIDSITALTSARGGALLTVDHMETTGQTTHLYSWSRSRGFVEEDAGGMATVNSLVDHRGAFFAFAMVANPMALSGDPGAPDLGTVVWRAPHG